MVEPVPKYAFHVVLLFSLAYVSYLRSSGKAVPDLFFYLVAGLALLGLVFYHFPKFLASGGGIYGLHSLVFLPGLLLLSYLELVDEEKRIDFLKGMSTPGEKTYGALSYVFAGAGLYHLFNLTAHLPKNK